MAAFHEPPEEEGDASPQFIEQEINSFLETHGLEAELPSVQNSPCWAKMGSASIHDMVQSATVHKAWLSVADVSALPIWYKPKNASEYQPPKRHLKELPAFVDVIPLDYIACMAETKSPSLRDMFNKDMPRRASHLTLPTLLQFAYRVYRKGPAKSSPDGGVDSYRVGMIPLGKLAAKYASGFAASQLYDSHAREIHIPPAWKWLTSEKRTCSRGRYVRVDDVGKLPDLFHLPVTAAEWHEFENELAAFSISD